MKPIWPLFDNQELYEEMARLQESKKFKKWFDRNQTTLTLHSRNDRNLEKIHIIGESQRLLQRSLLERLLPRA